MLGLSLIEEDEEGNRVKSEVEVVFFVDFSLESDD